MSQFSSELQPCFTLLTFKPIMINGEAKNGKIKSYLSFSLGGGEAEAEPQNFLHQQLISLYISVFYVIVTVFVTACPPPSRSHPGLIFVRKVKNLPLHNPWKVPALSGNVRLG